VGNYIRQLCLDDGFEPARDDKGHGFKHFDQCLFYVDETAIYFLDSAFTPALVDEPFWARGSGCDIAYGAYYALTKHADCPPYQLVERVVAAAICHDDGCGGDVWTKRLI
jgi:ATP-dependent protease HslVU (ClpYQ) peptidase subunit